MAITTTTKRFDRPESYPRRHRIGDRYNEAGAAIVEAQRRYAGESVECAAVVAAYVERLRAT
jgi:hypothetical protein